MFTSLADRSAIVTRASKSIGLEIARALSARERRSPLWRGEGPAPVLPGLGSDPGPGQKPTGVPRRGGCGCGATMPATGSPPSRSAPPNTIIAAACCPTDRRDEASDEDAGQGGFRDLGRLGDRAGALRLASEGAWVVVTDLSDEAADRAAREICEAGDRAEALRVDLTETAAIRTTLAGAITRHGRLDALHSHAGIRVEGRLEQVSPEQMDASGILNARSHFVAA